MRGSRTTAVLALAGALLLSGCASGGGASPTPSADACAAVQSATRDIANGAQNTLAAAGTPSEIEAKLKGYSERILALAESADNAAVADALTAVDEKIAEASAFVAGLPTNEAGEIDAGAIVDQQTAIQDAASAVKAACG
ncbi:hypothetical protein [Microterricola pindariensis]|uniref:hypothetical protein n=1 Tax=Microterricola pindariensis TaxID=478010 RepID=UPI001056FD9F|nr:hypothetical protein [Microterricola pindariensis]